ncbi:uncharacterized protein [Rutidosis leptorrhynchoides]|uniref:uncharacterized protein n=1 Tax=Rutidosis leptorrhynchoides TaxID=125765 RepID=UPI003A991C1D
MGICTSTHSTSSIATAKLILPDGTLQEFSQPIKVSHVINKYPSTFICNSDEMDFDDVVSPIKDNEELQLGQLYFALPLTNLKHPLQPEEMAALAVKASAALAKCGARRRRRKNVCFTTTSYSSSKVADVSNVGLTNKTSYGGGGKRQNFKVMLDVIPE